MRELMTILTGSLMWGLAWWPMKALDDLGLNGPLLAMLAYGAAALCLLPSVRRSWPACRPYRRVLLAILVSGGLWNVCYMAAMVDGHASRVILLYYLSSGWAILGGRVFLDERIDRRRWMAVALVFLGACLVLGGPGLSLDALTAVDAVAIVAGIAHASTNLMFRAAEPVPLTAKNTAMFAGSVVAAGSLLLQSPADIAVPDPSVLALGIAFGIGWLLLAESLTQYGVSRLPAARASVLLVAELPFTVLSAALIGGERLGGLELAGGALILLATLVEVLRHEPEPTSSHTPDWRVLHDRDIARA